MMRPTSTAAVRAALRAQRAHNASATAIVYRDIVTARSIADIQPAQTANKTASRAESIVVASVIDATPANHRQMHPANVDVNSQVTARWQTVFRPEVRSRYREQPCG